MNKITNIKKVDDFGKIKIPKNIRRVLSINKGAFMEFFIVPEGILLKPYQLEGVRIVAEEVQGMSNDRIVYFEVPADKEKKLTAKIEDMESYMWTPLAGTDGEERDEEVAKQLGIRLLATVWDDADEEVEKETVFIDLEKLYHAKGAWLKYGYYIDHISNAGQSHYKLISSAPECQDLAGDDDAFSVVYAGDEFVDLWHIKSSGRLYLSREEYEIAVHGQSLNKD